MKPLYIIIYYKNNILNIYLTGKRSNQHYNNTHIFYFFSKYFQKKKIIRGQPNLI